MNCKLCSALFQEFLDNSLSEELIVEVQDHVRTCHKCRISLRTYSLTVSLSQKVDPPCCLSPQTLERLKKAIREKLSEQVRQPH
jgi:predicted anti-sigma-YlaC factor YlaD